METKGDNYECEKCNKKYKDRTGLWKHRKKCHENHGLATNGNNLATKDDALATNGNKTIVSSTILECEKCHKTYLHRQGLWKHKKICCKNNCGENSVNYDKNKDELILMLIKENTEFKSMMMEHQNMMLKVLENGTTINSNNTTNSHNKAFNLNFFLNETCKNAMNITDFVDSIKLQLSDFMDVGKVGFVKGISDIIVNKLNSLDETVRPIHCTDQKRETFYVKDKNKWEKEEEDLKNIRKMIKKVIRKNEGLMLEYKKEFPDYDDPESKRSDQYSKFVIEALGGDGDNDKEKENKIINHISKATIIKNKK
jgi:hypothetical protein